MQPLNKLKHMIINQNKTNSHKIIVSRITLLKSALSKAKGLMFSKKISDIGYVFVFDDEKIVSLHMLFVFFPIDVLFLDKNKKIVEIKESFRPFTFYTPQSKAKYVVELPCGIVKEKEIKVGEGLSF